MEYLQYKNRVESEVRNMGSFKPCYKWNTFNTRYRYKRFKIYDWVLNLVISGIPSIREIAVASITFKSLF